MRHRYQPIRDLRTGEIVAWEALMRIPGRSPQSVLAQVGDDDNKQRMLDGFVVQSVRRSAPRNGPVFVNITPATVRAVLDGEPWPDLGEVTAVWELNESSEMQRVLAPADALPTLCRSALVALDDVGDGVVDVQRLLWAVRSGVAAVKLSAKVLQHADPGTLTLVRSILSLGIPVVAEGVERVQMLVSLGAAGVGYVQGFAVGLPT